MQYIDAAGTRYAIGKVSAGNDAAYFIFKRTLGGFWEPASDGTFPRWRAEMMLKNKAKWQKWKVY